MENKSNDLIELEDVVRALKGTICWSVIAGESSGSLVTMAFGKKLPRIKPLRNPSLTEEQRYFEGEYELFVGCAWRLETRDSVVCSSTSSNHMGGAMDLGFRNLIGRTVIDTTISYPAGDVRIDFSDGLSFLIFADQANEVDEYCNYTLTTKDVIITNGAKGEISSLARADSGE